MNLQQSVEAFIEPLILEVGGSTLDRMRAQLTEFLNIDITIIPENSFLIGCMDEQFQLAFAPEFPWLAKVESMGANEILEAVSADELSSVAMLAALEFSREKPSTETAVDVPHDTRLDAIALTMSRLYRARKGVQAAPQHGKVLLMALIGFTDLKRNPRCGLFAVWKRRRQGDHPPGALDR